MDVKLSPGCMRGAFLGGWGDRAITFGPPLWDSCCCPNLSPSCCNSSGLTPFPGAWWFCLISTRQEEEGAAGCGRDGAVYEGHKNTLREPGRGAGMVSSQPSQPPSLSLRLRLPTSAPPFPGCSSPPTPVPFSLDLCLISFLEFFLWGDGF